MNEKIVNATPFEYNGIKFKSKLEVMVYKIMTQAGFDVEYEPKKFIVWKGFKPNIPFYTKDKRTRMLKLDNKKIIDITYTPDFLITYNGILIVIEAKGFENDVFPYKKKLFRHFLEFNYNRVLFFEIFTKKQLLQAINIIHEYDTTTNNKKSDSIPTS